MGKADGGQMQMARAMPNNAMGMMNPMAAMGMNPMAAMGGGMGGGMGGMNPMQAMMQMMGGQMGQQMGGQMGGQMGQMGMNPMAMMGMNPMAAMAAMSMGGMGSMMAPMMAMQNMAAQNNNASQEDAESIQEREAAMAKTLSQSLRAGAASSEETTVSAGMTGGGSAARSNVLHLAYRPTNSENIHGVTDKRFDGVIKVFIERDGYGFVCSEAFDEVWEAKGHKKVDVFLHRNQKGHFEQGDTISFGIFMNFRGRPQATDLGQPAKKPDYSEQMGPGGWKY